MPKSMIYICIPTCITHFHNTSFWFDIPLCTIRNTKPNSVGSYMRKNFLIRQCIDVTYYNKLLFAFQYPCKEFTEQRERRIGNYNVCFVTKSFDFVTSEISITFKITPLQVVDVETSIAINIFVKNKNLPMCTTLVCIVLRTFCLK